ncbi:hypothetical protein ACSTKG_00040, partial [Vibrio parahaemolyticus]
ARDDERALDVMRTALDDVRAALAGRDTLLPEFSYADLAVAAAMQVVSPVADRHLRLGPATRRVWEHERL